MNSPTCCLPGTRWVACESGPGNPTRCHGAPVGGVPLLACLPCSVACVGDSEPARQLPTLPAWAHSLQEPQSANGTSALLCWSKGVREAAAGTGTLSLPYASCTADELPRYAAFPGDRLLQKARVHPSVQLLVPETGASWPDPQRPTLCAISQPLLHFQKPGEFEFPAP